MRAAIATAALGPLFGLGAFVGAPTLAYAGAPVLGPALDPPADLVPAPDDDQDQDQDHDQDHDQDRASAVPSAPTAAKASSKSAAHRAELTLTAETGVGFSGGFANFVQAGWYARPWWLLEGYYEQADTLILGTSEAYGLRSQFFLGNSLYLSGALLRRNLTVKDELVDRIASIVTASDAKLRASYFDMGPELAVGNRWQWSSFTLGCDWLGYYYPLYTSTASVEVTQNGAVTEQLRVQPTRMPAYRFLKLYVGFAF